MASACPTCATPLAGAYCNHCGQRAPRPDDFSSRRFFGTLVDEITSLDSRAIRTLRAIFIPGELTRAYAAREWARYVPPLRLYLVLSAVFFLLCWDTLQDIGRAVQTQDPRMVEHMSEAERRVMSDAALSDRAAELTAWARFFGVLLMAVWVALWQGLRKTPFGIHLVFATHYYCFDYSLNTLAVLVLRFLTPDIGVFVGWMLLSMLLLGGWAMLALRKVYRRGWAMAFIGAAAIVLADLVLTTTAAGIAAKLAASAS